MKLGKYIVPLGIVAAVSIGCKSGTDTSATTAPAATAPTEGAGKAPVGMRPMLGPGAASADSHVGGKAAGN